MLTTQLHALCWWCHKLNGICGQSWIQFKYEWQNGANRAVGGKIDTTFVFS